MDVVLGGCWTKELEQERGERRWIEITLQEYSVRTGIASALTPLGREEGASLA